MKADPSIPQHVLTHASMLTMTPPRRSDQPLFTFRLPKEQATAFREKCKLDGTSQQVVLETLLQAFIDGELPNVGELRLKQAQRAAARGDTSTSGD